MACDLTLGRLEPCKDSVGGIVAVYFLNFGDAVVSDDITDASLIDDLGTVTCYKYDVKGANSFDQNINSSRENGTTYWEQVLNLVFKKQDATTSKELKILAYGRPQIVVHYRTGDAVLAGELEGMEVTGGSFVSGTNHGDLHGYNLTLTGMERTYARHLKGATAANPFAGLTTAPTVTSGT